jgi:nitroreductase
MKPATETDEFRVLEKLYNGRFSCRAFLPTKVPEETLEAIFRLAQRVPSGCNSQPWRVTLVSGSAADAFREALFEHTSTASPAPDLPFPREYRGIYKDRRREAAFALFNSVGVARGDRAASAAQNRHNFRFFEAPHVGIITSEEALGGYGVLDCGIYVNALLLAAESLGISAVAQGAPAEYSPFIRDYLGISDDRIVVCSVSFGYADKNHPANRTRTVRAPLEEIVSWIR